MDTLDNDIKFVAGVGEARAKLLERELGIRTLGDMLSHYPFRYIDRTRIYRISEITEAAGLSYVQFRARITGVAYAGTGRKRRFTAFAQDPTGQAELVWFQGVKWIEKRIEVGREYLVFGRPSFYRGELSVAHPELETMEQALSRKAESGMQGMGCMWGVIFSFIEGRRMTDILASLLGVSMVISSGTAKSAGLYVMNNLHVNEFWMPALIGAVALPLLALLGYALNRLPQPTEEDIAMKSERATLNGKQRWELFKNFMPFLMMLFVANIAIVVLRDIKEDFLVNIIDVSEYSPWLFAKIDSVVTLIILVVFGLMVFVKDNLKALSILFGLIIMGMIVMSVVSFGQERFQLSPVVWLFVQSLCLYIAYLTFQTIFFDRFIACFKIHGNVGFFIVTTDFLGYTGTVLVLVLKEFCNPHIDWAVFYNQFAGYVGIFCCITFICSFVYLHQRFRKENGLAVKSNEVLELDTASRNAITMA